MESIEEKSGEKERLELVEKRVDIQKKRVEIRKEKLEVNEYAQRKIEIDEQKLLIEKADALRQILNDFTIDEERTILGSEPMLKSIISENEKRIVQTKLLEIIRRF